MNVMELMVAARAGWINQQQEDLIEYAAAASGFADCFATTRLLPGCSMKPTIPIFGPDGVQTWSPSGWIRGAISRLGAASPY